MAFRKKAELVLQLNPDLVIVPECEHPSKFKNLANTKNIIWHGDNLHKGLGVFAYNGYKIKLSVEHDPTIKNILPILVTKGRSKFFLLAIWAFNPQDKNYIYVGQVWKAICQYEQLLKNKKVILIGDLNSNVFWDRENKKTTHKMVVDKLESLNIFSTYHKQENLEHGKETHPTFFMYHHKNKPYHLDYCFASSYFIKKLKNVEIGTHEEWAAYSDHVPLIVSFRN